MWTVQGKSVFGGIAIGTLALYRKRENFIKRRHAEDTQAEVQRFEAARQEAVAQLAGLYEKAKQEVGESGAAIFDIHQMMLEDPDYVESVTNIIRTQEVNAEYAVGTTADNFAHMFAAMDDAYMQGRAADVKDISDRVVGILSGVGSGGAPVRRPSIIAAEDLAPSETVQLDKSQVLGFVTQQGSANSHTAILARTMNIPAVIHAGGITNPAFDGKLCVLDGFAGKVYVDPDEATLTRSRARQAEEMERQRLLETLKGKDSVTRDGQSILLYANIGSVADTGAALHYDADGIGLMRSEFLYLGRDGYPSEEEQFQAYRQVAQNMAGKRVIIRTLDIGADKQADYFRLPKEENPALGCRAIRLCLNRPELFQTQLRALYRASAYGNIAIMFPMITSVGEIRKIKEICRQVRAQLAAQSIPFREDVELGIMIETPAAVMVSDKLAQEVDFFSVGTNDLTQYTLAIDRQNEALDPFYDPHHPAVLRQIQLAADNAHKAGIWIGVCGELGADLDMTELFLAMGIDELSVSPACVLRLRQKVRETDVSTIRRAVLAQLDT